MLPQVSLHFLYDVNHQHDVQDLLWLGRAEIED
jgi:hypothetical protein